MVLHHRHLPFQLRRFQLLRFVLRFLCVPVGDRLSDGVDDIESVKTRQGVIGNLAVGLTPNPLDLQGSRFSVHYLLAEVLLKGKITDVASLKAAYDSINARCTDCHETYRVKLK